MPRGHPAAARLQRRDPISWWESQRQRNRRRREGSRKRPRCPGVRRRCRSSGAVAVFPEVAGCHRAASRRPRRWRREVLEEGCRAEDAESPPGPGGGSEPRLHPGRIWGCSAAAEVLWLCPSAAGGRGPGPAREGLYDVLRAGQRPLRRARVRLPVQLRQLQHRHVTQGTHLPHLQPLDEAPAHTGDTGRQWGHT